MSSDSLVDRNFEPANHPIRPVFDRRYLALSEATTSKNLNAIASIIADDYTCIDLNGRVTHMDAKIRSANDPHIDPSWFSISTTVLRLEETADDVAIEQVSVLTAQPDTAAPGAHAWIPKAMGTRSIDHWRRVNGTWLMTRSALQEIEIVTASGVRQHMHASGEPNVTDLTLESKLKTLAQCGLELAPPFGIDDILASWDAEAFAGEGYQSTLIALGSSEEQSPWRPRCVNMWHFDTECIEDHGSYVTIAERMKSMAAGSLPIENIRDDVDLEAGRASLSFDYNSRTIDITCKVNDDWVDADVFQHFVGVLAESDPTKLYAYYDLGGQDCIIACVTRDQLRRLIQNGIAFEALR